LRVPDPRFGHAFSVDTDLLALPADAIARDGCNLLDQEPARREDAALCEIGSEVGARQDRNAITPRPWLTDNPIKACGCAWRDIPDKLGRASGHRQRQREDCSECNSGHQEDTRLTEPAAVWPVFLSTPVVGHRHALLLLQHRPR
jgi:hypothetical protein